MTIASRSFGRRTSSPSLWTGRNLPRSTSWWMRAGELPAATFDRHAAGVFWSGSDGYYPLYTYDTLSGFLLADGESTTGHATIAPDGSSITFFGATGPVLVTTAAGVTVGELHDTLPTGLPQLQFFLGTTLLE